MLGSSATSLGLRLPDPARPEITPDISPDDAGVIRPGTGGMSVAPDIASLPPHAIPMRLQPRFRDAVGKNTIRVWRLGDGPFADAPLSGELNLRVDPNRSNHGFVEPARALPVSEYIGAIHRTRDQWVNGEDEQP
jgi:hypothetical protein